MPKHLRAIINTGTRDPWDPRFEWRRQTSVAQSPRVSPTVASSGMAFRWRVHTLGARNLLFPPIALAKQEVHSRSPRLSSLARAISTGLRQLAPKAESEVRPEIVRLPSSSRWGLF